MSPPTAKRASAGASGRLATLLRPTQRRAARQRDGYLDLLPEGDFAQDGIAQRLMHVDLLSRVYERWWRPALGRLAKGALGPTMADERRLAEQLLEMSPGEMVLDVACGPGNFSRGFARFVSPGGLVVGLDGSRPMLERGVQEARSAGAENVAFVMADAERLPFRDASFDAVCCFAALNLFADPFAALDEMRRVLGPGGRIALFTSCRPSSAPLRTAQSIATAPSGLRMFERDELTMALRERGFVRIRHQVTGLTQFVGGRLPAAAPPRAQQPKAASPRAKGSEAKPGSRRRAPSRS